MAIRACRMSDNPELLRRLLASVDSSDHIDETSRKLDAVLRACELMLHLNDLHGRRMTALTDALGAQIDRLANRIAEATSQAEALSALQQEKADLEGRFATLQAQFDEQSASLQLAIDRLAGM